MPTATVVGVGLIGGSIAAGLRSAGWRVNGVDTDLQTLEEARSLEVIDEIGDNPEADITFVCVPVGAMEKTVAPLLENPNRVVTDVGSVKTPVLSFVEKPNFVAGHPMAGSEQDGVEHARSNLFEGSTWILCPSPKTNADAYSAVQNAANLLGANPIAIHPVDHDHLVATISHLPHVVACSLVQLAVETATEEGSVLRLAGGGFRDMTRIASGHPLLWTDICISNTDAIVAAIENLQSELRGWREDLLSENRSAITERLARARNGRRNLPVRGPRVEDLAEIRIPIKDRPGVLAEVTTMAGTLGINISDIQISHGPEGDAGVLIMMIPRVSALEFQKSLHAEGYEPSVGDLK